MCYDISLTKEEKAIEERFKVAADYSMSVYQPFYHRSAFDKDFIYIIKSEEPYNFFPAYWGLMPESEPIHLRNEFLKKYMTFNARAEDLSESKLYSKSLQYQRCLIIADGFFEPHSFNGKNYPHYIKYKNNGLFAFAGIYTELDDGLYTATLITTLANDYFKQIHNKKNNKGQYRMPLVLDENDEADWLDANLSFQEVNELLFTFTHHEFESYPVTQDVMNRRKETNTKVAITKKYYPELETLF
ncbi:MAG: SOS response-associated peptidase [Flavobacteriales bacterium]